IYPWLRDHADDPAVADAIAATIAEARLAADASAGDVAAVMLQWMDDDVKATPLKTVQGQIWAAGFADGELEPHFFDDVEPAMRSWRDAGLGLAVFSSGSVEVQRPWFARGLPDVAAGIDAHFDTVNAGNKRVAASYETIAADLGPRWSSTPAQLVFLSDVPAELDAAAAAGWQTIGVRRAGEPNGAVDFGAHRVVDSFAALDLEPTLEHSP
ncbi:MAG: acireductone synthase, partial [Ilumatobacteraceae bacterium]